MKRWHHSLYNWRTTLLGLGAIFTALGDLSYQIGSRDWHFDRLGADVTGIFTGLGLLFARDSAVSEQAHVEDRSRIEENTDAIEQVK